LFYHWPVQIFEGRLIASGCLAKYLKDAYCIWLPSTIAGHVKASYDFWSRFSWHDFGDSWSNGWVL